MFKCLLNYPNLKSILHLNFYTQNYANFSKKFLEKQKKIKGFLSTQKQNYKIQLLERKHVNEREEVEEVSHHKKYTEAKFSDDKDKIKRLKKMNNIINNKNND